MASLPARITGCRVVQAAAEHAMDKMKAYEGAHSFQHVLRVHRRAVAIADELVTDGGVVDIQLVQLGALLHDIYDRKVHSSAPGEASGEKLLTDFLRTQGVSNEKAMKAAFIAEHISFSKQKRDPIPDVQRFIEMDIVQDADRLDSIGAIGIARVFAYGGHRDRTLEGSRAHFDEKLFKLLALMRTDPGRRIARERHEFMLAFVRQLDDEMGIQL